MSLVEAVESLDGWATERLETEIALVAAHLAAAECRWLTLVAEFDRREAWASWGCASAAHWLNYRCGLDLGTARERVRVARRLGELPQVSAAFEVGELTYSKVRAVTRVATSANEEVLVDLARSMTASQVERVVRYYRLASNAADADDGADEEPAAAVDPYPDRFLTTRWNDDGSLSIKAKLPPAEGAMVMAALSRAADALYRDRHTHRPTPHADGSTDVPAGTPDHDAADPSDHPEGTPDHGAADPSDHPEGTPEREGSAGVWSHHVPAGTSCRAFGVETEVDDESWDDVAAGMPCADPTAESPPPVDGWGARQADALVAMADTVVGDGLRPGSGPNRHTVVIHTTLADLNGEETGKVGSFVEGGPSLGHQTVRRLMCDSSLTFVLEGPDGAVVNVSRRAPSVPTALARAVKLRDGCCVFPGCTRQAFVDLHHIIHRTDGGPNTLANCCSLCRVHHRMVHEGGFTMASPAPGRFQFHRPDGSLICSPPISVAPGDGRLRQFNAERGVHLTEDSPVPDWDGSRPDYPHLIDILLDADHRLRNHPPTSN